METDWIYQWRWRGQGSPGSGAKEVTWPCGGGEAGNSRGNWRWDRDAESRASDRRWGGGGGEWEL